MFSIFKISLIELSQPEIFSIVLVVISWMVFYYVISRILLQFNPEYHIKRALLRLVAPITALVIMSAFFQNQIQRQTWKHIEYSQNGQFSDVYIEEVRSSQEKLSEYPANSVICERNLAIQLTQVLSDDADFVKRFSREHFSTGYQLHFVGMKHGGDLFIRFFKYSNQRKPKTKQFIEVVGLRRIGVTKVDVLSLIDQIMGHKNRQEKCSKRHRSRS